MKLRQDISRFFLFIAILSILSNTELGLADEEHEHPAKPEKKMEMHHHSASSKNEPKLPPGTKEVKIDLSGPFCHRHPEEIIEGLMKLEGILHVEAFKGRKYILVHFDADKTTAAEEMVAVVTGLKGNGWRCKGSVSTKRSTER